MADEYIWVIFVAEQKSGELVGMDAIHHEHFHFKEMDE